MLARMAIKPVLAAKRVFRDWLNAASGKPIWPFPTVLAPKAGVLTRKHVMQRCLARTATGLELAIRPGHLVMQSEHFGHSFAQEFSVVSPWSEPADIHRPKIQCWFTRLHPFGQVFPRAACARDADGVKPGRYKQIPRICISPTPGSGAYHWPAALKISPNPAPATETKTFQALDPPPMGWRI